MGMKMKNLKANLKMKLSGNLDVEMFFDTDMEELLEEGNGAGEKYILCSVRFYEAVSDEYSERQYFFPIETKFSALKDLFVNELWMIARSWKKGCFFDAVTESNPETAWLFYKKTFDHVMKGEEIWKNSSFAAEIVCELPGGDCVTLKHLEDDTERLFRNDEYLGRVGICAAKEPGIVYCSMNLEDGMPFFCNTEREKKYPGATYKPFMGSKTMMMEAGVQIQHTGSMQEIVAGMEAAVSEFITRR